jgi:hypothetical protein
VRVDVRRLYLVVVAASLAAEPQGGAQSIADLPSGARVRITLPDSVRQAPLIPKTRILIGSLVRATTDTIWVDVAGPDTLRLPRAALRRIDVSRGVSRARSAAEQGLFVGAMVGLLRVSTDDGEVHRRAIGFAALGAAFGGVLGAWQPYEHWRAVR